MTTPNDLDRQLTAFLQEGPTELPDPSFDAVRDRVDHTRQRVVIGLWRFPDMNKYVPIGVGSAAVVGALLVGSMFLGSGGVDGPVASPSASPTPTAEPSPAEPTRPSDGSLPVGPFQIADQPLVIGVDIPSSGWMPFSDFDGVLKADDGLDPPQTVGALLVAWAWPAGTGFDVYGDPCHWSTTIPETAATTPDEIAAALAAQAASDPSEAVDVTVGGHTGKAITLHVPMSYDIPGASREERFADCDQSDFGFYAAEPDTEPTRNAQGAGQIDELWILDVDGSIVILDATYSPATPTELVDEMRAMAHSATFE